MAKLPIEAEKIIAQFGPLSICQAKKGLQEEMSLIKL